MVNGMQLLILILNKTECLDNLFENLIKIGVKGATVIESTGMARLIGNQSQNFFESIKMIIDPDLRSNLTLFMAVDDTLVDLARETIDEVVGGLAKPDTGVLFGLPISFFDGKVSDK